MSMSLTRFLLAGCGTIGERHAKLAAEKGVLVAVCDIDEKKVKTFSAKYNCYGYTSLKEMLKNKEADALLVCTPNGLHATHSISGLKAGVHVLCEKPFAMDAAEAKDMVAAAETCVDQAEIARAIGQARDPRNDAGTRKQRGERLDLPGQRGADRRTGPGRTGVPRRRRRGLRNARSGLGTRCLDRPAGPASGRAVTRPPCRLLPDARRPSG